jgi:hypothetical protein
MDVAKPAYFRVYAEVDGWPDILYNTVLNIHVLKENPAGQEKKSI